MENVGYDFNKNWNLIRFNFQKAFENLDHKILLDKIKCIGLSDKEIKWFISYLTDRAFFLSLGTIQRVYIGTFVVLLYINDNVKAFSNTHTYLDA